MKINELLRFDGSIVRVLDLRDTQALVIDCLKRHMPEWVDAAPLEECERTDINELCNTADVRLRSLNSLSPTERKSCREKYSVIAPVLSFIGDEKRRIEMIYEAAERFSVSKQTVRKYLCLYLSFQDEAIFIPPEKIEKPLTKHEKNMRWALNKYYYTRHRNTLTVAYTHMLQEKYTVDGVLIEPHPSISQFRYFYRKTKKLQTELITREGKSAYQRNHRPLLGDGILDFAPNVGVGMFDSTIADIYLVDSAGKLLGRPVITICVDACSSLCMGYLVSMDSGVDSLRRLLQNVICDKVAYCRTKGITITEDMWPASSLPGVFVTDNGREYVSAVFDQLADLGVSLVNLPPFRPELKGVCEKCFDLIQSAYKPYLKGKGVIEPDFQKRGARDYRLDACLTLEEFERVILRCIIYYNTQRVLDNYPFSADMLNAGVAPFASEIFRYGHSLPGVNLIEVTPEELRLTLLPRTLGKFCRKGLIVNKLRYRADGFTEEYLNGGDCTVAYDPEDVSVVWLLRDGAYTAFSIIEKAFAGKTEAEVAEIKTGRKAVSQRYEKDKLTAQLQLAAEIQTIAQIGYERKHRMEGWT